MVDAPYPGSRATRDGGTLRWSRGLTTIPAPLDVLLAFIAAGRTKIDRAQRRAAIHRSLQKAEAGTLVLKVKPDKYHDVAPIVSNPKLLEIRWRFTEQDEDGDEDVRRVRLYFDEPVDAPDDIRALHAHEKTSTEDQDVHIGHAEKVRVEGTDFT